MSSLFTRYNVTSKEEHDTDAELEVELIPTDETDVPLATEVGISEMLVQPETPDRSEIEQMEGISGSIDEVVEKIDEEPEVSLEHFRWVLANSLKGTKLKMPKRFSLESKDGKPLTRKGYQKQLKMFKQSLDLSIAVSVEAYDDEIGKTFDQLLAINAKLTNDLKRYTSNFPKGIAVVDNPEIIKMFVRHGTLVESVDSLVAEGIRISALVGAFEKFFERIEREKTRTTAGKIFDAVFFRNTIPTEGRYLLFNRYIEFNDNGIDIEQEEIDGSKIRFSSSEIENQLKMLLGSGVVATVTAIAVALAVTPAAFAAMIGVAGLGVNALWSKISNKIKLKMLKDNQKNAFQAYTKAVVGLDKEVNRMVQMNERLTKLDEDGLNKERIPVMQKVMIELIKHINELQYTTMEICKAYREDTVEKLEAEADKE